MKNELIKVGGPESSWIDPAAVIAIRINVSYPGGVEVILSNGSSVRAAGSTDEVAKLINDALKSK